MTSIIVNDIPHCLFTEIACTTMSRSSLSCCRGADTGWLGGLCCSKQPTWSGGWKGRGSGFLGKSRSCNKATNTIICLLLGSIKLHMSQIVNTLLIFFLIPGPCLELQFTGTSGSVAQFRYSGQHPKTTWQHLRIDNDETLICLHGMFIKIFGNRQQVTMCHYEGAQKHVFSLSSSIFVHCCGFGPKYRFCSPASKKPQYLEQQLGTEETTGWSSLPFLAKQEPWARFFKAWLGNPRLSRNFSWQFVCDYQTVSLPKCITMLNTRRTVLVCLRTLMQVAGSEIKTEECH